MSGAIVSLEIQTVLQVEFHIEVEVIIIIIIENIIMEKK